MAKDQLPGRSPGEIPGTRSAQRRVGINGNRFFGEGDGRAPHGRNLSEADRQLPGPEREPQENPDCIGDIMALGSPRDPYTPGGREPISFYPAPGRYPLAQDGTPAERGLNYSRGDRTSGSDMRKDIENDWERQGTRMRFDAKGNLIPPAPPEDRSTGVKPPM